MTDYKEWIKTLPAPKEYKTPNCYSCGKLGSIVCDNDCGWAVCNSCDPNEDHDCGSDVDESSQRDGQSVIINATPIQSNSNVNHEQ